METHLDEETQGNLKNIPQSLYNKWGFNGVWSPFEGVYQDKTIVRSGEEALDAFDHYTEYFEHIIDTWSPSSDQLVLVPCGSSKPIGSSTIHQKKIQAIRGAGLENADIVVVSEPCTVVPPEYRLSLPAANYDFPPKFTVQEDYPEVFNIFTQRLATWLDQMGYKQIFPYLISGHQNKFDEALTKMETSPEVYEIPSASYNTDTSSYSGDRFKTQEEMIYKVASVLKFKAGISSTKIPKRYEEFYQDRWD